MNRDAAFSKSSNNNKLIFKLRCSNVVKKGRTHHVKSFPYGVIISKVEYYLDYLSFWPSGTF